MTFSQATSLAPQSVQSKSFTTKSGVTSVVFSDMPINDQYFAMAEVRFGLVPEPSSALLGGLGMLALLRRRR